MAIEWIETTAERFDEMLCVLPPASRGGRNGIDAFQVGEAVDHDGRTGRPRFATFKQTCDLRGTTSYESAAPHRFAEFKAEFPGAEYYYGE